MAILSVRKLSKSFGGVHAVERLSFSIPAGHIVSLIGPNGAGKTTVFNLVSGLLTPDEGTIEFAGSLLTHKAAWQRARVGISRTFQLSRPLKNLTVFENLALALRHDDDLFRSWFSAPNLEAEREKICAKLAFVSLPKEMLDRPVTDLSFGQQKLFDLSRALLHPHRLLMLDEPVAGINPVLREQLKGLLKELRKQGETILLIEHDMDFVRAVSDEVYVMEAGRLIASGEVGAVLKNPAVLDAYLGTCL